MEFDKKIYLFSKTQTDGSGKMNGILGSKGAALAEMCKIGLPIPAGFTIASNVCDFSTLSASNIKESVNRIKNSIKEAIRFLENSTGKVFGNYQNPLLFSVRSGAKISMPGMMDTVLNLGLNDQIVEGLSEISKNKQFAYDSYRRFIQMYANIVMNVKDSIFEEIIQHYKGVLGIYEDYKIPIEVVKKIIADYKDAIREHTGNAIPSDPYEQLWQSVEAVFLSWHSHRAVKYRELHNIPNSYGTAVNVQSMVFGNFDDKSATGVVFTRNPSNGNNEIFGEFLINAQGEDIVAGIRNVQPINNATKKYQYNSSLSMEELMPEIYGELVEICKKLERYYKNMQDIEFTVESGKLWILQTRSGKCNIKARLQIASDMIKDGITEPINAICNIDAHAMERLLHPIIDDNVKHIPILKGLAASPGAVSGKIVLTSQKAERDGKSEPVILIRTETSPEDISGMSIARGILTARGGMTSHAAVIARGMGKPCVCGANQLMIDEKNHRIIIKTSIFNEGDFITINGSTGEVFQGIIQTTTPSLPETFKEIIKFADSVKKMKIMANAETKNDIHTALKLGAEGIGLCRTEHMFFAPERLLAIRKMIIARDTNCSIREDLDELIKYQQQDFEQIFELMNGLPTTIRLLDPPLHEFLPKNEEEIREFCQLTNNDFQKIALQIDLLHESNPMLGHRGCRLAITCPEIYAMQARAIFNAMTQCNKKGIAVNLEIMIPLVLGKKEVGICKRIISDEAINVEQVSGYKPDYLFGTMIELPRAALCSSEIAELVDFISFGTNDLTQTTMGISRDDSAQFLQYYLQQGVFEYDPFISIDENGVGMLIKIATEGARKIKPKIKIGVCGEHGGDPRSIAFFRKLELDYVSCSPFRIPTAKIASAQAEKNV